MATQKVSKKEVTVCDFPEFALEVTEVWEALRDSRVGCKDRSAALQAQAHHSWTPRKINFPAFMQSCWKSE